MTDTIKQIEDCILHVQTKGTQSIKGFETSDKDEFIESALSALQKMASGEDWFDIKSAPRDGTEIMTKDAKGYEGISCWIEDQDAREYFWCYPEYTYGGTLNEGLNKQPNLLTHWKHIDGDKHIAMLMEKEVKG